MPKPDADLLPAALGDQQEGGLCFDRQPPDRVDLFEDPRIASVPTSLSWGTTTLPSPTADRNKATSLEPASPRSTTPATSHPWCRNPAITSEEMLSSASSGNANGCTRQAGTRVSHTTSSISGVAQCGVEALSREVGIRGEDLIAGGPGREQIEQERDGQPGAAHAGLPGQRVGITDDPGVHRVLR